MKSTKDLLGGYGPMAPDQMEYECRFCGIKMMIDVGIDRGDHIPVFLRWAEISLKMTHCNECYDAFISLRTAEERIQHILQRIALRPEDEILRTSMRDRLSDLAKEYLRASQMLYRAVLSLWTSKLVDQLLFEPRKGLSILRSMEFKIRAASFQTWPNIAQRRPLTSSEYRQS